MISQESTCLLIQEIFAKSHCMQKESKCLCINNNRTHSLLSSNSKITIKTHTQAKISGGKELVPNSVQTVWGIVRGKYDKESQQMNMFMVFAWTQAKGWQQWKTRETWNGITFHRYHKEMDDWNTRGLEDSDKIWTCSLQFAQRVVLKWPLSDVRVLDFNPEHLKSSEYLKIRAKA